MINLDYYRLLPDVKNIGAYEEADTDCHYTSYSVFVLETRLYPLIYKMFSNVSISLRSHFNMTKNRMDVALCIAKMENSYDPFVPEELVTISQEQEEKIKNKIYHIQSYHPEHALIDVEELYKSMNISNSKGKNSDYPFLNNKIPFSYFAKMLEYVNLDGSYNPFIRPEGIYLSFNPNGDYNTAYQETCEYLIKNIQNSYKRGLIILGNLIDDKIKEKLIKDWRLVPIDVEVDVEDENNANKREFEEIEEIEEDKIEEFEEYKENKILYGPDWVDARFAQNPVDFLTEKIRGDVFVRFRISDNLVKRHGIAAALEKEKASFVIEGSYLKAESENLQTAQRIASLIDSATSITNGRVLVIASNRLAELYLYFEYVEKLFGDSKNRCIAYSVDNNENQYIFSCLLPETSKDFGLDYTDYTDLDELRLAFRDYAVKRFLEVGKISKFKNMSPYDIIEKEYTQ